MAAYLKKLFRHNPLVARKPLIRVTIDRRSADLQQLALAADGQGGMRAVDHRATLGPAYLPSLLAKKSFSTFSWPIWRCSSPTWISLVLSSRSLPFSNTPAAPSSSAFFQAWIWLGWTLNSPASSPTVRSPLSAAKATFALNVALCFCRDCFMTAPVSGPFIGAGLSHRHLSHIRGPSQLRVDRLSVQVPISGGFQATGGKPRNSGSVPRAPP